MATEKEKEKKRKEKKKKKKKTRSRNRSWRAKTRKAVAHGADPTTPLRHPLFSHYQAPRNKRLCNLANPSAGLAAAAAASSSSRRTQERAGGAHVVAREIKTLEAGCMI